MIFVDTNYFLRYILADIPSQYKVAQKLLQDGASNKIFLFTSTLVFFEIHWVLTSHYKKSKSEVINILNKILSLKFVKIANKEILVEGLKNFENTSLSFEDSYHLAYAVANKATALKTFDKRLQKEFTRSKETSSS